MNVVVVGAGPAGVATALLLARCGVEVTVVERETSFERVFRGEGLMPTGIDALLQMGPGDVLKFVPSRRVASWHIWIDGREAFVIPEPVVQLGDRAMQVVSQPALLEKIIEAANRYPSFSFTPGSRFRDLLHANGRVAGVRIETASGTREVSADVVIGCDARASAVRAAAGLPLELSPEEYDVLWCKLPAPEQLKDSCVMLILVAAPERSSILLHIMGRGVAVRADPAQRRTTANPDRGLVGGACSTSAGVAGRAPTRQL